MCKALFELIEKHNLPVLKARLKEIKAKAIVAAAGEEFKIPDEFLQTNGDGETFFHIVVRKNSLPLFQCLVEEGVPLLPPGASGIAEPAKDKHGYTLLHAAVAVGSFEMVQELVAWDFPLLTLNSEGHTALQMAIQRAAGTNQYNLIAALLRSRHEWQNQASGFRFNRAVHLIQEAFPNVYSAQGQDKCLLIGRTGSGKSTLLNYMNGARYELKVEPDSGKHYAECFAHKDKAVAEIGMGMISQTLYPQVIKKAGLNFVYCDLAGLFDSRGDEERICAASSVQILSRLNGKIKCILVVLDLPSLQPVGKGEAFKQTALALSKIIQKKPELMSSVYFIITHVGKDELTTIKAEGILNAFVRPIKRFYQEEQRKRKLDSEEESLKFMIDCMDKPGAMARIKIPNISDHGETAMDLEQAISILRAEDPNLFSFVNHDRSQEAFNSVLLKIADTYLKNHETRRKLKDTLAIERKTQQDELSKIKKLQDELKPMHEEKNKPFDFSTNDPIAKAQAEADYRIKIANLEISIKQRESSMAEAKVHLEESSAREKQADSKLHDLNWELQVNQKLYGVVFEMLEILNISSSKELLRHFRFAYSKHLHEQTHPDFKPQLSPHGSSHAVGTYPQAFLGNRRLSIPGSSTDTSLASPIPKLN